MYFISFLCRGYNFRGWKLVHPPLPQNQSLHRITNIYCMYATMLGYILTLGKLITRSLLSLNYRRLIMIAENY